MNETVAKKVPLQPADASTLDGLGSVFPIIRSLGWS